MSQLLKPARSAFREGFIGALLLAWKLVKAPVVAIVRVMNEHVEGNMQVTFGELKIGDYFWDNTGTPARKVSEDAAQYDDGDREHYHFYAHEKVDKA